jgi:Ca2+/Na+ antiporter
MVTLYTSLLIVSVGIFGVAIFVCLLFGYCIYTYSGNKSYNIPVYNVGEYIKKVNKWKWKSYRSDNAMMRWPSMNSENVNVLNYIVAIAMVPIILALAIPLAIYYMIIDWR